MEARRKPGQWKLAFGMTTGTLEISQEEIRALFFARDPRLPSRAFRVMLTALSPICPTALTP